MIKPSLSRRLAFLVSLFTLSALVFPGFAQSDNFDAGTLDPEWNRAHFNPALVNLSFPDTPTGKGLRIVANPVPDVAPAATLIYRDEEYEDFYLAVDVTDWPGTDKNQAIVLIARAHLTANPADATGIILNYDFSQYGENPNDRRQGQFQINMVTNNPAFGTKTLAVAEVTMEPGRPFRMVFRGEGSHYTGQLYDLHDLTQPVVTIEADDAIQGPQGGGIIFESGFTSGKSGIISFSRQGTSGTTDVTIDNYYAGASAPNAAEGAALAHPVAGTPVVESRMPSSRFTKFHDPAAGISFTATTHSENEIDAAATRLFLNGADVSTQLVLPANGSTIEASLPGSALQPNTVYSARIELREAGGTRSSVNTFWFDTYSDEWLSSGEAKTIEAEEYNYDYGAYQADPIPVSGYTADGTMVNGFGAGYLDLLGYEGVDYHDNRTTPEAPYVTEFRMYDPVGHSAGMYPEISDLNETSESPVRRSDHVRSKYADEGLLEYVVHRTEPGEWLNYTREFEEGTYAAWLRVASFGATEVELHQVTGDPENFDQTTERLGTFEIPNMITRYNYRYIPLVNDDGSPAILNLGGEQTLRLLMGGTPGQDARKLAINYILLVPHTAPSVSLVGSATVTGPYTEEAGATINPEARTITIPRTGQARFYQIRAGSELRIVDTQISGANLMLTYE